MEAHSNKGGNFFNINKLIVLLFYKVLKGTSIKAIFALMDVPLLIFNYSISRFDRFIFMRGECDRKQYYYGYRQPDKNGM